MQHARCVCRAVSFPPPRWCLGVVSQCGTPRQRVRPDNSTPFHAPRYFFNPSILDRIELKPTSIEQEIFPAMADDNNL
jgi:hypothetical protein